MLGRGGLCGFFFSLASIPKVVLQVWLRKPEEVHKLPSMLLTNSRSIVNKLDELNLNIISNKLKDCGIQVFMETWLHPLILDIAIDLACRTSFNWDRNNNSGKKKGGGYAFLYTAGAPTPKSWTCNCSPDLEYLMI